MRSRSMAAGAPIRSPGCRSKSENSRAGAGVAGSIRRDLCVLGVDQAEGLVGAVRHGCRLLPGVAVVGCATGCPHAALGGIADWRAADCGSLDACGNGRLLAVADAILRADGQSTSQRDGD